MFKALQAAGLTLKPSKVQFGPREVKYLGHVLTAHGIRIGEDRIKAIVNLPTPTYQAVDVSVRDGELYTEAYP